MISLQKKILLKSVLPLVLTLLGSLLYPILSTVPASAVASSDWQAGRIIDDGIFYNSNDMTVGQVQAFLNSEVPTCDTWGTQTSEYGGGTRAQYGTAHGYPPPYICLKNYYENPTTNVSNLVTGAIPSGGISAAQIIVDAAQTYGISVRALLATLQKESSGPLITDTWPFPNQYTNAMGYGCPDTAPCDPSYAGFYNQVTNAARQFSLYKANPTNYRYLPQQNNTILYSPNTACGSSTVFIQNDATAGLYNYTPYQPDQAALNNLYGTGDSCSSYGNRNFWRIFNDWFGSTTYSQPLSSLLVLGNQSGKIYYISLDNDTRYYVPTWSTLQAYGLDHYQIMPMDDSEIDNYTDGGVLKTLVWDNNDQKIYLVDGDKRYWFQQYCTQWGLDCTNQTAGDVTFLTSTYFEDMVTNAGLSQPTQLYNGTYYLMQNGLKEPFADASNMQAMGYSPPQAISISQGDLNSNQTLGALQIVNPTFIEFSPNPQLLYFDGQSYHHVDTYGIYQNWGSQPIANPPVSTLNTTLPTLSTDLDIWAQDGSGNKYLIDSGRKIDITSNASTWYSGSYLTFMNPALAALPTIAAQTNVNVGGAIYVVQNQTKRHVPTYDDYKWLGINPGNTLTLSSTTGAEIPTGPDTLRDGALFTVAGNPGLYVTNNSQSYHIPSMTMFDDYGFNWSLIHYNLDPSLLSSTYPSQGELSRWVHPAGGNLEYITGKRTITIDASSAQQWGINLSNSSYPNMDLAPLIGAANPQPLGQFVEDISTGGLYYGSGGYSHYIASYNTFVNMGGLQANVLGVSHDFLAATTAGSTYN